MKSPKARAVLAASMAAMLSACGSDVSNLSLSDTATRLGLSMQDSDSHENLFKIPGDSSIPIMLASNKQETTFTVNGTSLPPTKSRKILVPKVRLDITARAPCYKTLKQTAEANGFGPSSLFEFTFADWDKDSHSHETNCT